MDWDEGYMKAKRCIEKADRYSKGDGQEKENRETERHAKKRATTQTSTNTTISRAQTKNMQFSNIPRSPNSTF